MFIKHRVTKYSNLIIICIWSVKENRGSKISKVAFGAIYLKENITNIFNIVEYESNVIVSNECEGT